MFLGLEKDILKIFQPSPVIHSHSLCSNFSPVLFCLLDILVTGNLPALKETHSLLQKDLIISCSLEAEMSLTKTAMLVLILVPHSVNTEEVLPPSCVSHLSWGSYLQANSPIVVWYIEMNVLLRFRGLKLYILFPGYLLHAEIFL